MIDPSREVEDVAIALTKVLGDDWESLSPERRARMRATAFYVFENTLEARKRTMEQCVSMIEDLMNAPSTPKRWLPGIKEAMNTVRVRAMFESEELVIGASVPEHLPSNFEADDPYEHLTPGDFDPNPVLPVEERCGARHDGGWECTRAVHPPHWRHWDSDREVVSALSGQIHTMWYTEDDELALSPAYVAWVEEHEEDEF